MTLLATLILSRGLVAGAPTPIADLPFQMVGNHIYVEGEAMGKPISVLLDSGAGASIVDSVLADSWNVTHQGNGVPVGGAGGKVQTAQMFKDFSVKLKGTSIEQPIMIGIPLTSLANLEGRRLEAIFGFEFFRKYVVEIDYANRHVRFFAPDTYVYSGKGKELPFRIVSNHPHFEANLNFPGVGERTVEAMFDTGAGASLSLTQKFVSKEDLDAKLPKSPQVPTGAGVGGMTFGRPTRLDAVSFGGYSLDKPTGSLELEKGGVTGSSSNFDVLIGGEVAKRFTVTLDYPHKRLFLEPNRDFKKPFVGDVTGLRLQADDTLTKYSVLWIVADSPAAEAGIHVGDRLVSIDGKPAERLRLWEVREALAKPNRTYELVFDRGGDSVKVRLKARPLV